MKRIMGTLLVARAVFPAHFCDDLEAESHRITTLTSTSYHTITSALGVCGHMKSFQMQQKDSKSFSAWADIASEHFPPSKKNSGFVLVILKPGEFLFFTRSSSQGCFKSGPEDTFRVVLTTQAIKKALHFEFMKPINFPRKSPSLLLNHSLGRDRHTSHPWRRENTALLWRLPDKN